MKKSLLSLLLALVLTLSLLPLSALAAGDVTADFTDPVFKAYVLENWGRNGLIYKEDLMLITELDVSNMGIKSLNGLKYFPELKILICYQNTLTKLDVTRNLRLVELDCSDNNLVQLDLSQNEMLTNLYCTYNQLTTLDLSKNNKLWYLFCDYNKLSHLTLPKDNQLRSLGCSSNALQSLDLSAAYNLYGLYCDKNQLTELDVSQSHMLEALVCNDNKLTSLDLSNNTKLHLLNCSENYLANKEAVLGMVTWTEKLVYVDDRPPYGDNGFLFGPQKPLTDITPSSWAAADVNAAIAAHIVPGSLRSHYGASVTRTEFCALATALYETVTGTEITERKSFDDTADVNVEKMGALGVVKGTGGNSFSPKSHLSRQEAAVMLYRLANAMGKSLALTENTFADKSAIESWAVNEIGAIQGAGVMNGTGNNRFDPNAPYTRQQSIITMLRMYNLML